MRNKRISLTEIGPLLSSVSYLNVYPGLGKWRFRRLRAGAICLLSFFSGFILTCLLSENIVGVSAPVFNTAGWRWPVNFDTKVFASVFSKNIMLGIWLAIPGFFSGGILTMPLLFWNGMVAGEMVKCAPSTIRQILPAFVFQGMLEVYAYCLLGAIGLRGWLFYKMLFDFDTGMNMVGRCVPDIGELAFPAFLLLVSSLVETVLVSGF